MFFDFEIERERMKISEIDQLMRNVVQRNLRNRFAIDPQIKK